MKIPTNADSDLETAIRTSNLTKEFDGRKVVNEINLTVSRGEIYGFLGPNGAGKTTTIRMILGFIQPSNGNVEILGEKNGSNFADVRKRLGVVGENIYLYDNMTAWEYLEFFCQLYGVKPKRSKALMERMELADFGHLLANDFSQGMKKKLSLARALLHDPEVIILDEPTSGLDPYGVVQVRELLDEKREAGCAIILSSHILSEIERTADRVGIIHHGRLLREDTLKAVTDQLISGVVLNIELENEIPGLVSRLDKLENVRKVSVDGRNLVIEGDKENDMRASVSKALTAMNGVVIGMNIQKNSLEEAFMRLTEGELSRLKIASQEKVND